MATSINAYEKLYNNMKTRFTVVNGDSECSLGEYMLLKAKKQKEGAALPVSNTLQKTTAVTSFFRYVNDKLMVKEAPAKDKIIRAFPFRTTAAAVLSAMLICTFAISYGAAGITSMENDGDASYMSITEDIDKEKSELSKNYKVN